MQIDEFGKIRVANSHPDKTHIEELVATHPELGDTFRAIAANARLLKAVQEARDFQRQFAVSPAAAVAGSPHLFTSDRQQAFDLFVGATESKISFV